MYQDFHRRESENNFYGHVGQPRKYEPDEAAAVSLLQYMSREQLEEYLNSMDKLDAIIADLPELKAMNRDRENLVVKNKSLAEYNLGQQPKFEALKREVATEYEEVNALKMALGANVATLESCAGTQSHDTMLAILQTEVATTDETSEDMAEKFCDGQIDIDTFISEYISKRTIAYIQGAKLEKMTELVRQQEPTSRAPYPGSSSAPVTSSTAQNNIAKPSAYAGYSSAPYPANSFNMPTPYYRR